MLKHVCWWHVDAMHTWWLRKWALFTMGLFTKKRITFRKPYGNVIRTLSWFESPILPFVNAELSQSSFKSGFWNTRLDRDPPRKPDSEDVWTQSSFGTWFVRAHFGNANLRSRNKILLTVHRSCSWSGWCLQCLWTHIRTFVVQITNPLRKWIAIRNSFRNVIPSFVNRPNVILLHIISIWLHHTPYSAEALFNNFDVNNCI